MANKKTQKDLSSTQKLGIGVGLTAAAVAAAGTYFLYGSKSAAKNRKAVKSWTLKAKAEVLEKLEDAKEMTKEEYEELINSIAGAYVGIKNATKGDIGAFKNEMKEHWKAIEKTAAPKKKAVKKAVKDVVKKVAPAKKVAKKAVAKQVKK
jgi:6-phosphogluconolactonase (cycloisomerase 2 family)